MSAEVGCEAPDFELKDQHGQPVKLSDYRGERNVLLVFYPFAFTGVCTGELAAIRDEPSFGDDAQVLTVSVDSVYVQRVFAERENLTYPLLSDFWPHGAVAQAYGVFDDERGCALRGTFVIDKDGVVRWKVVNDLPDARDVGEYLKVLAEL
jgi:mycoredoxin-dependent peroxiredoxin